MIEDKLTKEQKAFLEKMLLIVRGISLGVKEKDNIDDWIEMLREHLENKHDLMDHTINAIFPDFTSIMKRLIEEKYKEGLSDN